MIEHPRHNLNENIVVYSVEQLNRLYLEAKIDYATLPYDIVISCLADEYGEKFLFGDWIDFDDTTHGLYQKHNFPGFFLAVQTFLAQSRSVYIIVPQRAPVSSQFNHHLLNFIEFNEFYGLYHRIFDKYYGKCKIKTNPSKKFTMLNKRLRPSRLYSFANIVHNNLCNKGIVSLLAHGDADMNCFDNTLFTSMCSLLENHAPKDFDSETLQKVKQMVPFENSVNTKITDDFLDTGGWIPDIAAFDNSFVDVIHETHENLPPGSQIFTEKTMRSIFLGKPFLLIGSAGSLNELHKLGFKTFNDFWPEDYDLEPNLFDRVDMVLQLLYKICDTPYTNLREMRGEMQQVFDYNQQNLKNLSDRLESKLQTIDQFINSKRVRMHGS